MRVEEGPLATGAGQGDADPGAPGLESLPAVSTTRLYSYLVTRHTGRAVRLGIERRLEELGGSVLAVLDFRDVPVIDFSCADEIVVKLVRQVQSGTFRFLLCRGLAEHHRDPIQSALERQEAAVAAEDGEGRPLLLGRVEGVAARTWHEVREAGRMRVEAVAARLSLDEEAACRALEGLAERRLVLRAGEEFVSLWRVLDRGRAPEGGP